MTIALVGIGIALLAGFGAWLLVRRHTDLEQLQIKLVYFGLYFWALIFLQILLLGMRYYFNR